MAKRSEFIQAVFAKVDIPFSTVNKVIGVAWCADEGSEALNNPLDTTEDWPGATDYNDAGVKNYLTWDDGVDATVATLQNGDYTALIYDLASPDTTVMQKLNAINASPWGSTVSETLFGDVRDQFATYDTEVAGSPAEVTPPVPTEYKPTEAEEDTVEVNAKKFDAVPVLREGDKSKAVVVLTVLLKHWGYLFAADGDNNPTDAAEPSADFTPAVTKSVKLMQTMFNIKVDGEVGPEVWSAFFY